MRRAGVNPARRFAVLAGFKTSLHEGVIVYVPTSGEPAEPMTKPPVSISVLPTLSASLIPWGGARMAKPKLLSWLLGILSLLGVGRFEAAAYVAGDGQTMISSFNNAFYFTASGNRGYFRNTTQGGTTWFWGRANQMEMLIDLYEQTSNTVYLTQFQQLYNGFVSDYGTSWIWNEFNDDIMWMVIACARAYQYTGNTTYRNVAKSNFDSCYARAWSVDLGGGLWWKSPLNTSKNACVNGPAAIAAYLIYQNYNDVNYRNTAESLYQWMRTHLFDANTGRVYDSYNISGTKDTTPITYNSGTFIGAANYLGHTNDAILAANYVKNSMGTGGQLPNYDEHNDLGGFNGIFVRWMVKFMNERGLQSQYQLWLQQNANAAWNVRRASDNLSWSRWWDQTPNGQRWSFGCWGSVLIVNLLPATQNPGGPVVFLNTCDANNTSSFNQALNWSNGEPPSWTNHYVVANGRVLRTPPDNQHHSFAGSSLTFSNGGVLAFKNTSGSRYVSVGTDLFLDGGEVANWAGQSASLGGKVTLLSGGGKIDPQGNTFTFPALLGGAGTLRIGAGTGTPLNGTVVISGVNTYTAGTVIEASHTVQINNAGTLGVATGSLTFTNIGRGFGTINLNGTNLTVGKLAGLGGVIRNNKSASTGLLTIGAGDKSGGVFLGVISNGVGTVAVRKIGAGVATLAGTNTWTGGTEVSAGALQLGDGATRNASLVGPVNNAATLIIANPFPQIFTNVITGGGALTKTGAGLLTLMTVHGYTGKTTITAGTLALTDPADISSSAAMEISAGATLNVTARASRQLVLSAGRSLAGGGTILGGLEALAGSIVRPGAGIGVLTVSENATLGGELVMELDRSQTPNADQLVVGGNIVASGTLTITNRSGELQVGDRFQLFNGAVNGFAEVNLPELAPELIWQNDLAVDGSIRVAPVVATTPVELTMQFQAGGLKLNWPAGHTGWRLQVQTNGPGMGLSGSWLDVPGAKQTNELILPIDTFVGSGFYRLIYP
jgi:autotransporter-associated beta strand protein